MVVVLGLGDIKLVILVVLGKWLLELQIVGEAGDILYHINKFTAEVMVLEFFNSFNTNYIYIYLYVYIYIFCITLLNLTALNRSYSPRDRSPKRRSVSPPRGRSYSKSPPYNRGREESPFANGYAVRHSRSFFFIFYFFYFIILLSSPACTHLQDPKWWLMMLPYRFLGPLTWWVALTWCLVGLVGLMDRKKILAKVPH